MLALCFCMILCVFSNQCRVVSLFYAFVWDCKSTTLMYNNIDIKIVVSCVFTYHKDC
jgi:hypothetical protein